MFEKPKKGIVVDAATSGNPGISQYRGMDLSTGEIVFSKMIGYATNNITEFLALVHGVAYSRKQDEPVKVYSDSITAISWVKNRRCNSYLAASEKTKTAIELVNRAEKWLRENKVEQEVDFDKWESMIWGENPADYGFKTR